MMVPVVRAEPVRTRRERDVRTEKWSTANGNYTGIWQGYETTKLMMKKRKKTKMRMRMRMKRTMKV
jgi:hypothetical protein